MMYKIYKLIHNGLPVYVGQTKQTLHRRKQLGYKKTSVEHIAKDCSIELIEETDDAGRESYWIAELSKQYSLLNIRKGVSSLSRQDYLKVIYNNTREQKLEKKKEYYLKNSDRIKKQKKEYYQKKKKLKNDDL